ncbi:MAG: SDR family NAD(P)-dependent oxidoreductase [Cypionkella sp.]
MGNAPDVRQSLRSDRCHAGLGAVIAQRRAAAGAAGIVITGRNLRRGDAVAKALQADFGTQARFLRVNIARVDDCRHAIAGTDRMFGRIDVLVNAGASTDRRTIPGTSLELFDPIFATNVSGPDFLMQ